MNKDDVIEYFVTRAEELLTLAYRYAVRSNDPSTQNGAVVMSFMDPDGPPIGVGWNRLPRGMDETPDRMRDREFKYANILHAEETALTAASSATDLFLPKVLVCPWAFCLPCAGRATEHNVVLAVVHRQRMEAKKRPEWDRSIENARRHLLDNGVVLVEHDGLLPDAPAILVHEQLWRPSAAEFVYTA